MNRNSNKPANHTDEWFSANGDPWMGGNGDTWQGGNGDPWAGADGGGERVNVQSAQKYILKIVNACTSAISNVDIGDSYANRSASNFGQSTNITITSVIPNVSYIEYLGQSESQPFTVGQTMIVSSTANQLDEIISVTHRNASGNVQTFSIQLDLDPYQNQTDRILDNTEYLFDGFTRLRWTSVLGSATIYCRQYLKGKFAPNQIVANRPALQLYQNPRVVKAMPMAVGPNQTM